MNNCRYFSNILLLTAVMLFAMSCNNDNEYSVPEGVSRLSNDCLKNSIGVNMVGASIDFSYAMAMPKGTGHIVEASVIASCKGADGTMLENNSYHTNGGYDEGVKVGEACENIDNMTKVVFKIDTCAATLRYHYVVPEEMRGKEVSFTFSAKDSNGKVVSKKMGPYTVSNMDMALDIALKNNNCFSISEMRVLTAEEAEANPEKVDFVYSYQVKRGVTFKHAFISPTAENLNEYMNGISLPAGIGNSTKMLRTYGSCDQQLARDENAVFVDDIDLRKISFSDTQDFMINILEKGGAWMETSDGKYRAYIYINTAPTNKGGVTVSMKRLKL